jgi:hypothetical protein
MELRRQRAAFCDSPPRPSIITRMGPPPKPIPGVALPAPEPKTSLRKQTPKNNAGSRGRAHKNGLQLARLRRVPTRAAPVVTSEKQDFSILGVGPVQVRAAGPHVTGLRAAMGKYWPEANSSRPPLPSPSEPQSNMMTGLMTRKTTISASRHSSWPSPPSRDFEVPSKRPRSVRHAAPYIRIVGKGATKMLPRGDTSAIDFDITMA